MKKQLHYSKEDKRDLEFLISMSEESFKDEIFDTDKYIENTKYLYVIIEKGKLKEIKILKHNDDKIITVETKINIREDIEVNKLSKNDLKNIEINNVNYEISSHTIEDLDRKVYISLEWYEYWKIKWYKKDTWLHRSKLMDKVVFTFIGSIITFLLTKLVSNC
ncbi:hypothetical protein [Galbibacter sp. BG1]